jgi:hypothetical protein
MCGLLGSVMELQELEIGLPDKPRPTVEELDEAVRAHIGSGDRMQPEPAEPDTRPKRICPGRGPAGTTRLAGL